MKIKDSYICDATMNVNNYGRCDREAKHGLAFRALINSKPTELHYCTSHLGERQEMARRFVRYQQSHGFVLFGLPLSDDAAAALAAARQQVEVDR